MLYRNICKMSANKQQNMRCMKRTYSNTSKVDTFIIEVK